MATSRSQSSRPVAPPTRTTTRTRSCSVAAATRERLPRKNAPRCSRRGADVLMRSAPAATWRPIVLRSGGTCSRSRRWCASRSRRVRQLRWRAADMATPRPFRCAVLSAVKHDYVARGVASHPRFELAVVADDPHVPDWAHERNQQFADARNVPYVRDVDRALREFDVQVAIVSSEAERHCDLSVRAARAGKHVVQDKPMATRRADAERLVEEVERQRVKFLMWNRNFLPGVLHARDEIAAGAIGRPSAVHVDFYFAKDAGPPKGSRQPGYPPIDWLAHQVAAHVDGSDGALGRAPLGELANEAIYPLGYVRLLTGAAVRRVFARSAAFFHQAHADNGVEDLASVTLEMDGGLVGSLAVGRIGAASHPSGGEMRLHVLGTAGALVIAEARPEVGVYYRDQPAREHRQRRVAGDNDFLLADDFARAVDADGETVLDARAGLAIFATVEAALESCRSGQPVEVR